LHIQTIFLNIIVMGAIKAKASPVRSEERRYFKEVRFRQIRALFEISRHGSFAAAARALGMATPSVWRQVRALEDDYGVRFVAAKGRSVRLTEDGERLMGLAAPLVEGFDSLRKVFLDLQSGAERVLRLAASASVLNSPLRHVIAKYRLSQPSVRLTLIDAPSRVAWGMVESDSADLAIVGAPSGVELPLRLSVVPFASHPFEVIFPEGHPLGKVRKMGLRDILRYPLILAGEDSSSRLQFDHVVSEAGLTSLVNIVMTAGNVPSILNYVGLGMGVAILTRSAIEAISFPAVKKAGLAHRDASAVLGHDNLVIVHPKGRHELEHIRVFREMAAASLKADG
jgi:molybdate transport repressor ModE-like protein